MQNSRKLVIQIFTTLEILQNVIPGLSQSRNSYLVQEMEKINSYKGSEPVPVIDERILERADVQQIIDQIESEFMQNFIQITSQHVKSMADEIVGKIEEDEIQREEILGVPKAGIKGAIRASLYPGKQEKPSNHDTLPTSHKAVEPVNNYINVPFSNRPVNRVGRKPGILRETVH